MGRSRLIKPPGLRSFRFVRFAVSASRSNAISSFDCETTVRQHPLFERLSPILSSGLSRVLISRRNVPGVASCNLTTSPTASIIPVNMRKDIGDERRELARFFSLCRSQELGGRIETEANHR